MILGPFPGRQMRMPGGALEWSFPASDQDSVSYET